ncbi:MAG: cupin domain-containing protein, partial [Alphaproteobacteria bacterium]|nr:cupin domain-containing protein [Alphaproteobacteria bacterium]
HCHETTIENFFCLDGRFEVTWGDEGENGVVLEPNDLVSVPPGVSRAFRNLSGETARLLVVIETEGPGSQDRVAYAPSLGDEVTQRWGRQARAKLEEIGFRFDAGVDA